ncbi:MAG TPA: hypothetical protein VGP68_13390 [Gemmataceae bacterium]|jgi:hypothetical protein|nr:hypothetical protein [Gemmataceae bacterium]
MRTTGQIGLALVAIIALVAGVTYLSHYGPSSARSGDAAAGSTDKSSALPQDLALLTFKSPKIDWMEPSEGDFEMASHGFHDFWFQNGKQPTRLGLDRKNCKCTDVEIMVLDEEHLPNLQRWFGVGGTTVLAGLQQGPMVCVSLLAWEQLALPKLFGLDMKWEMLDSATKNGVVLPPKGGGLVRVHFEGKKDLRGPFLLKATLWAEPEGSSLQRTFGDLEMPLNYVEPISLSAAQVNMESFNAKDEKTGGVMVYSTTQAGFDLYVTQPAPSPLVDVQIDDLNGDEIVEYGKAAGINKRILSAKRVKVTVRERVADNQRMDLGPFYRKFWLSRIKEEPEELLLTAVGDVRGELIVGSPEDRGRVNVKTFRSNSGTSKTVTILAEKPGMELDLKDVRVLPENVQEHMSVRLEKVNRSSGSDQRNRWHLHVELKPGFPPGKMPEGSAVYLQIAGSNPPRQIRIPLMGMAYQ